MMTKFERKGRREREPERASERVTEREREGFRETNSFCAAEDLAFIAQLTADEASHRSEICLGFRRTGFKVSEKQVF